MTQKHTVKTKTCKCKVKTPKRIGNYGVKGDPWSDLIISTPANKMSYALDISEYMQKQNSCKPTIIAFLLKKTDKAVQLKEVFGYGRTMWFPKGHVQPTPQTHAKMTVEDIEKYYGKSNLSQTDKKKHLLGGIWYGDDQIEDADGNVLIPGEIHNRHKQNIAQSRGVKRINASTTRGIFSKD